MSSLPAARVDGKPRKPRPKPVRTLQIVEPPAPMFDGYGALKITEGKQTTLYLFREIPSELPGRAFAVEKLAEDLSTAETYAVRIGAPADCSCECKGWEFRKPDACCRHVAGLLALEERGQLARLIRAKEVECPRCGDVDRDRTPGMCAGCQAEDSYQDAVTQEAEMEAAGLDPWAEWDASAFADDTFCPADADF